ncbi:MAG: DUF2089 domain-containing protein [Chloroflexi bacterium]|nr:DUF2089 domain-containing protein [Chloroflexota bacterium]
MSRKEILELLAAGQITADEAAALLKKTGQMTAVSPEADTLKPGKQPSWLHVRVRDLQTGRNKVTVNIPLRLVKFGMRVGRKFSPELDDLDWDEITSMMSDMDAGMLVDVQDEEDGEHVQVYVD